MLKRVTGLAIVFCSIFGQQSLAQNKKFTRDELAGRQNTITSAAPFLGITPDARAAGIGDVGVATSPDVNSIHWNAAKLAFMEDDFGVSLSYTPWLKGLVNDIHLSYLTGYKRIDKRQVIAASLRYFSLGNITFTTDGGQELGQYRPNEFALDFAYSLMLSKHFSGAVALRYIYSDLTGGSVSGGSETNAGRAVAADFSMYYHNDATLAGKKANYAFGLNVSNLGSKISYSDDSKTNFLPTNLRLGGSFTYELDDYNKISFSLDANKLLIPTPEYVSEEETYGKVSDVPVMEGLFQSFYDAPGGMKEELNEISYGAGLEYWYANQFAVRGGYFYENETKGNRKFLTAGVGLKLNVFTLDFAYLVTLQNQHPLHNTMRFTLTFDFDSMQKEKKK